MLTRNHLKPNLKKAKIAWCLFDWANSAFPTVIVTFVFSTYFANHVALDKTTGTAQWSLAVSLSGIAIAVLGPLFGAIADSVGPRKPWLAVCCITSIIATTLLWFVQPAEDYVLFGLIMFAVANVGFEIGQVFYNALLPELAPSQKVGRLSGWGWGLGYIGGLFCLFIVLFGFVGEYSPLIGLDRDLAEHVRVVGPIVAVWFLIFCIPLFIFVPDLKRSDISLFLAARKGFTKLKDAFRLLRSYPQILWFLLSRFFFVDGMNTLFAFGGIYAAGTFGMTVGEVIVFGIALNVAAAFGAFTFAGLDKRLGARATIIIALSGLILFGFPLLFVESIVYFWIFGVPLGVFMGPAQAASRSLMARLAPAPRRAEMFGLFAFSGKASSFLGPFILGIVTTMAQSQRLGMATIIVFISIGLTLFVWKVNPRAEHSQSGINV